MNDHAATPRDLLPARIEARLRPPRPPPPWMRGLLTLVSVLAFAAGLGFAVPETRYADLLPGLGWYGVGALIGLVAGWLLDRNLRVPDRVPPLVLNRQRLVLPPSPASDRVEEVELTEVESVDLFDRGRRPRLALGTRAGVYVYPMAAFEEPKAAKDFVRAVIVAIASIPGGHEQLAEMQRRAQVNLLFARQRMRGTYTLLQLVVAGFALQHIVGAFDGSLLSQQAQLVRLGANASALVAEGEWWRLFVANFLHGGWLHIGLNSIALVNLGGVLERLIGTSRFVLVFLASGVGGALASAWAEQGPFSVGASTAIFGLLGAFAVMSWRFGRDLPTGVRQTRRWWVLILGINGALPLVVPIIDMAAHVGGFFAGALVAYLAYPSIERFVPGARASWGIRAGALALSLVYLVAGVETARRLFGPHQDDAALVERVYPHDIDPQEQNNLAWIIATAPGAIDARALEAARHRAQIAVDAARAPDVRASYLDTLATAEYRVGNRRRAVQLEREAILQFEASVPGPIAPDDDSKIFWSQLARFAHAAGAPVVTGTVAASEVALSLEAGALLLERPEGLPMTLFAQVGGPHAPKGVVRLGVDAKTPSPASFELSPELHAALRRQPQLQILVIDVTPPASSARGVQFRAHDSTVDDLP